MSTASPAAAGRRVLVVDDSRAMQAIIRRVLQSQTLGRTQVETVASGEEALAAMERGAPDLVVSDWHMPGMTGIELLQTLRQMGHGELPFGFVTTETMPDLLQQALTNGAAFIVHKPFHDHELIAAVGQVLGCAADTGTGPDSVQGARAMRRIIQSWMPGVPFRVIDGEKFASGHLSAQNLFAVYSPAAGEGSLCALAAADLPALCLLGGCALQADPAAIRQAIKDNSPSPEIIDSAIAFLREMAPQLPGQIGVADAVFKGANLVARDAAKLQAAVDSGNRRADYRLSVPGYGDGRVVFIGS